MKRPLPTLRGAEIEVRPVKPDYRAKLAYHRENVRRNYARLRELAAKLVKMSLVRYEPDKYRYVSRLPNVTDHVSVKHRIAVTKFIQLQNVIDDQSRLLLELEWTIEQEERKQDEKTNAG
jgi:hypothetical protein